jgi:hypothetical protein
MPGRPTGMPLAVAITLALIVKIVLLMMLHRAFFSAPQAKKMRMPTPAVEQHLLGAPPPQPVSPNATRVQP